MWVVIFIHYISWFFLKSVNRFMCWLDWKWNPLPHPPPSSSTAGNLRLPLLFCIFYVHLGLFPVADNNDLFALIIIFLFVCLCFSVWIHSWFHSNEFVIEDNKNRIRSPFFFSFQILFWPNFGFRFSFFFLLLFFVKENLFIFFSSFLKEI